VEELPRFLPPMLLSSGPMPEGDGWALEVKWDGMRAQVRWDGRRLCLRSRPGRDRTHEFPELAALGEALSGRKVLLDGELVCLGEDGAPRFEHLRARLGRTATSGRHATLMVFDVLHLDGRAARCLPYAERRALLAELELAGVAWRTPEHFPGRLADLAAATAESGVEGIVAKRLDASYVAGRRSSAWVKQKHRRRETLVVTGWRPGTERTREELLVARRLAGGELEPAGSVALGLNGERRTALLEQLVDAGPRSRRRGPVRWVRPEVTVEVECHGPAHGPVRDAVLR